MLSSSSAPTASVFEVIFPDQRTLGLHVLPLRLSFTDDDLPTNQVYGCQVTRSSLTDEIQEGDILVSVNGIALLSSTNVPKREAADPNQTILGAIGAFDTFLQMTLPSSYISCLSVAPQTTVWIQRGQYLRIGHGVEYRFDT